MNREDWAKIIRYNPIAFGVENGFDKLTDIHNEWLKEYLFGSSDYTLQAHRGSYKTTVISIGLALEVVIKPRFNTIFIRRGDADVAEILKQSAALLKTEIFQSLSYSLYNQRIILEKESSSEIDTNLKTATRGAPQILGIGSRGSLTGKHGDKIVTDDIVNLTDRISQAERKRTKLAYQELQNVKNRGGRIFNCGTPWHKDDAFTLMPNIHSYTCYDTGLITTEEIASLRQSMTPSLFAANYEMKHIADEEAMFTAPIFDNGENTNKIYHGIAHIDASYGGADSTAFSIAKEDKTTGKIYVFGLLKHKHVDDTLPEASELHKFYKAGTIHCEDNADKGYLRKKLSSEYHIPSAGYHEALNKYIKISTYLRQYWNNIVFIQGTNPEYVNQILDYTEDAEHDDAPDSLASLIRIIKDKQEVRPSTLKERLGL